MWHRIYVALKAIQGRFLFIVPHTENSSNDIKTLRVDNCLYTVQSIKVESTILNITSIALDNIPFKILIKIYQNCDMKLLNNLSLVLYTIYFLNNTFKLNNDTFSKIKCIGKYNFLPCLFTKSCSSRLSMCKFRNFCKVYLQRTYKADKPMLRFMLRGFSLIFG